MPSTSTTVAVAVGIAVTIGTVFWLGSRSATPAEQRLWDDALAQSSGAGLREYLQQFPNGVYADDARARLDACETQTVEHLGPMRDVVYPVTVAASPRPQLSEGEARQDARDRGNQEAAATCAKLRRSARLLSSLARPHRWQCSEGTQGHACGYEGEITCRLKDRELEKIEHCPGSP